jgi:SSS family solute:Na+ symporter
MLQHLGEWLSRISGLTQLSTLDWLILLGYFVITLVVGLAVTARASKSTSEYFLSGRRMPWWLLGFSMVATTFSSDTPNLVTDITRQQGVAGNWQWWAFLLTGMLTVFIYARLWRRSGVMTDIEFYELRYSGWTAAFLRGFRALYLGVFFNVLVMASVTLAAIKIGGVMLGLTPLETIFVACLVTAIYSTLGGLTGVILTDMLLFLLAMGGAIVAATFAVQHPAVGGLQALWSHEAVCNKLSFLPSPTSTDLFLSVFLIPLTIQWWSVWYPGSEPGGGGYIAQRMLAAKSETHATGATLFFNIAHYAVRPWPWIIVALCSLVVFPDLDSLARAFPHLPKQVVRHDLAYPAMLTFLPPGWMGLVIVSLVAAYMSTISTHLNWGSSYVVNDFYKRFVRPGASEGELVGVGRISTLLLTILMASFALLLSNALQAFHIMLQVGAGTGLLFILRWFWWRINALSELTAMVVSFAVACYFQFFAPDWLVPSIQATLREGIVCLGNLWGLQLQVEQGLSADAIRMVLGVAITTVAWIAVTLLTKPTDMEKLVEFCRKVRAGGPGWRKVLRHAAEHGAAELAQEARWEVPAGIACMLLGCVTVYGALFSAGAFLYGRVWEGTGLAILSLVGLIAVMWLWRKKLA